MLEISKSKKNMMNQLSTKDGVIAALAIDQRGALKKMFAALGKTAEAKDIEELKVLVSKELTKYSSSILLDPEYGLPAADARAKTAGLLFAYEKTGYDTTTPGRLPDLLQEWSVERLKARGADAIKFLLYYDVDEGSEINDQKHIFIERLGSECAGEDMPFYLELVSYDANISDVNSREYAVVKPRKVIEMMKEFSKPKYKVDVLKVEVPVNMRFVEGFAEEEAVYTQEAAQTFFKEQSEATTLPFIFLSGGVSAKLFQETLLLAKEAGSEFNGVLCGRATWKGVVEPFVKEGPEAAAKWLATEGRQNIEALNEILNTTASTWHSKVKVKKLDPVVSA
ncbi:tagatose-bisphosphate aldolase [Enterococcus massiliensis]|uniref:tagatose-bisphosphate aldolase n=1 Tax=Enterococcus massiliensis TaxID=1640685 RepID=UPI00065E2B18|nr:tagatose-bisphosphate aldolase [Enterococcus massiliensis]